MVNPADRSEWKSGQKIYLREPDVPWTIDRVSLEKVHYVRLRRVDPDGRPARLRIRSDVLDAYCRALSRQRPDRDIQRDFGIGVRAARVSRDLSQAQFAPLASLRWGVLERIEIGRRSTSIRELYDLANALGVAPSELLP